MSSKHRYGYFVFSFFVVFTLILALFAPTSTVLADENVPIDSSGGDTAQIPTEAGPALTSVIYHEGVEIIPDQYIVVYKSNFVAASAANSIKTMVEANGGEMKFMYTGALNGFAAYLPQKALDIILADPNVDYVEADGILHLDQDVTVQTVQANPTWGLDRIDQHVLPYDKQYGYAYNGTGVRVYVLDTGVRSTHTDFGGRAYKVFDAIGDGQNGNDCNGHGTHVAGTIAGTTYGVAKGAKIYAVRVLDCSGSGSYSQVIAGVDWVRTHHIHPAVASMSLGGAAYASLDTAINNLIAHGVLVVVAAGNSNANACNYSPARVPNAMTVAATTSSDARASYSNYGSCVDIFAPGSNITSAWNTSDTATNTISGTSMATPHVTGVVANYLQTHTTASPAAIVTALKSYATNNLVTNPGTGSPNKLLFSLVNGEFYSIPVMVAPRGATIDTTPLYRWTRNNPATKYQLQVYKGSTLVKDVVLGSTVCSGYYCSYNQPTALSLGNYTAKVRAYIGSSWASYSKPIPFIVTTTGTTFFSYFTSDAAGWSAVKGTWGVSTGALKTPGIYYKTVSVVHSGRYTATDFAAILRRLNDASAANRLYVRGNSAAIDTDYGWTDGYLFQYANTGDFSIWKVVDGMYTALVGWTYSSAIHPYTWNTLDVKISGTAIKFYINGTLVASGSDPDLSAGQLGIGCFETVTGAMFYVDYARALTTFTMAENEDMTGVVTFDGTTSVTGQDPNLAPE